MNRKAADLLRRVIREAGDDRILGLAAEVAFWTMLSMPSLLLAVLGLVGFAGDRLAPDLREDIRSTVLDSARQVFTADTVRGTITPLVDSVLTQGSASVATLGFALALWSGSAAMNAYVNTITVAYDMKGMRSAWRTRVLAFGLYLGALAASTVLLPLLLLGPGFIVEQVPLARSALRETLKAMYWPAVAGLSIAALATLYHLAVPARTPWRRDLIGAVVAMLLWLLGSVLLRTYLRSGIRNAELYGSAGAPIAILLFFYVTALAVLIGAELNATVDEMWPSKSASPSRSGITGDQGTDSGHGSGTRPELS